MGYRAIVTHGALSCDLCGKSEHFAINEETVFPPREWLSWSPPGRGNMFELLCPCCGESICSLEKTLRAKLREASDE